MNKIVRNDVCLKINLKSPVKIKQPIIIPTINIPPKQSPDKIIPLGTVVNLKSKVVKSPTDKSPNMIFSLRSVVIIAGNVGRLCAGGEIAFRLPITEVQFIDKSSLFFLLLNVIRHAGTEAYVCT
jgi:hypothetical protein